MTGPRELLDAYAGDEVCDCEWVHHVTERVNAAPKAFAALRAVLGLHKPDAYNRWCEHCAEHEMVPWPCPTVQAITNVLERP